MDDPKERSFTVDHERSACLCREGAYGVHAVIVIGPTGDEHAAMVDLNIDRAHPFEISCPSAPHEQLGPLPDAYVQRLRSP